MDLEIIGPLSHQVIPIVWLEVNTPAGNFVIQPGHAPLLVTLSPGQDITFGLKNGKFQTLTISAGILNVERTKATIILAGT